MPFLGYLMKTCQNAASLLASSTALRGNEPESELSRERQQRRTTLELNPDAIYVRFGPSITYTNPAAVRMFGAATSADLIGLDSFSLIHESDHVRLREARRIVEAKRTIHLVEFKMMRLDGSTFDAETFAIMTTWEGHEALMVTVRDISARKQAERRLLESETKHRTLFEVSPDAICVQQGDQIVFANPAAATMFGYESPAAMTGLAVAGLVHPMDREPAPCRPAPVSTSTPTVQHLYIRRDGTTFSGQAVITSIPWNEQAAKVVIIRDMTDYLRAEAEARKVNEVRREKAEIEQALAEEQMLNGLQRQFVSMVSHEFRTPLAIVDGNAQRLMRRIDNLEPDKLKASLTKIRKSVARMTGLMESVLSVARLESGQIEFRPAEMDLTDLLTDLCHSHQELFPDRNFRIDIDRLTVPVRGDEKLLCQVFSNLMSNAVKYSPENIEIRVEAWTDAAGYAVISVQDQGLGIPPEELDKLFERFFRASTSTGIAGTGIGLHLVKHLIDLHDGEIAVSSCVGEGSTFTVKLPPIAAPAVPADCSLPS